MIATEKGQRMTAKSQNNLDKEQNCTNSVSGILTSDQVCSVHHSKLPWCCNQVKQLPGCFKYRIQAGSLGELFKARDSRKHKWGCIFTIECSVPLPLALLSFAYPGTMCRKPRSQGCWNPNLRGAIAESSSILISCTGSV